ncbi:aminotransferase class I/II-fold pyridoxal phosphate-dependent enzyme [Candidatus Gottesmanbacteria bacterium]|nr:aminotransferase class I/II-fold pyridoxal phosphate-dependent enzyme [Candidatus Gottesmanbacteria bacterium]
MYKNLPNPSLASAENEIYLSGERYLDFTDASPQKMNTSWIDNLLSNSSLDTILAQDTKTLIENIKTYFKNALGTNDVQLTYTAAFAFSYILNTLLSEKQNEIIMLEPEFQVFSNLTKLYRGKPIYVKRNIDNSINLDELKKAYTPRTAGVIIISPDNPTGKVYPQEAMEQVAEFCIQKDIALIMDQCFIKHPIFVDKIPLLADLKNIAQLKYLLISDTGKTLGLKGIKIGALASSHHYAEAVKTVLRLHFFQYNQASLYILSEILTNKQFQNYVDDFNSLLKNNYEYLSLNLHPSLTVIKPEGGTVCLLDISKTGKKDVEFNSLLKERHKLATIPYSFFYNSGTRDINYSYLRFTLARPQERVKEAVDKINLLASSL